MKNTLPFVDIWITKFAKFLTVHSNEATRGLNNYSGTCKIHKRSEFFQFSYFGIWTD